MIKIVDIEALGISAVDISWLPLPPQNGDESHCRRCLAHRPDPDVLGNLRVDPEIHLPSPGMDFSFEYYYNANSSYNGPFGYGRTASTNLTAQACVFPTSQTLVTLTRGNGSVVSYLDSAGAGAYFPQSLGLVNSLYKDTSNSYWKETTADGITTAYPLNTTGVITSVAYAQDAVGNRHTFAYSSGLLQSLQDAAGR